MDDGRSSCVSWGRDREEGAPEAPGCSTGAHSPHAARARRPALPEPSVPTERFLIHTYHDPYPDPSRTAAATILQFKADGQYVERTGYLTDSGKGDLSFAPGDSNVVVVGTWDQRGATLTVRRERVARAVPYDGPALDPMCRSSIVEYHLAGDGVRDGKYVFRASSRLRLDDWESYVSKAESSGVSCSG